MARHKRVFNEQTLRQRAPRSGRAELGDVVVPGLTLRITPRGVRTFSVIYKVPGEGGVSSTGRPLKGRQRRVTLGTYPAMTLKRARDEARKILETVSEGRDPRPGRRAAAVAKYANTLEAVTRRLGEQDQRRGVASWQNTQRVMALHVLPQWGTRPISAISRGEIHSLLDDLVAQGRVGVAREVMKHLSKLYHFALDREIVAVNPVSRLQRPELAHNEEAGRALGDEELRAVWAGAAAMGYPFGPCFQLLMLTGQRRSEIAEAQRSQIDANEHTLEIPSERYKSRRDHVVPLSPPAWEIFEGLPVFTGNDYCLFSTRAGRSPISGFSAGKRRLDKLVGDDAAPWRTHDMRVTAETRLAGLGIAKDVRDAALGHLKSDRLQRVYNKHDYLPEKRAALTAYAEHLLGIVS